MRKNGLVVLATIAVLFAIVFAHQTLQVVSAALPAAASARFLGTSAPEPQQYPIMDKVADKIIQKYKTSTCEQLWQEKASQNKQTKSTQEQQAIAILRNDPQMRAAFLNKVAAPIANNMFECGMIP